MKHPSPPVDVPRAEFVSRCCGAEVMMQKEELRDCKECAAIRHPGVTVAHLCMHDIPLRIFFVCLGCDQECDIKNKDIS